MSEDVSKKKNNELAQKLDGLKGFIAAAGGEEKARLLFDVEEIERALADKKYGLVFEERREDIEDALDAEELALVEDGALSVGDAKNILIEGDNLASLTLLEKTHAGKVDIIYIDPPYNTGNRDFVYGDSYTDAGDAFRHSKWLSFMQKRLAAAKRLLAPTGSVFISIDDNSQAALKLLCDDVFGADAFISCIPRITKRQRSGQERHMDVSHDYIVAYSFAPDFDNVISRELDESKIKRDKNGRYIEGDTKPILAAKSQGYSKGGDYDFEYNGRLYKPVDKKGVRNRWLWTRERMQAAAELGILVESGSSLRMRVYIDKRFEEKTNRLVDKCDKLIFHTSDFMTDDRFANAAGVRDLQAISPALAAKFNNPKPVALIQTLIRLCGKKDAVVLDFFAGSGTTAQAVMAQNAEDGGSRAFVLCTNNENNICRDVTYARIVGAIKKYGYDEGVRYWKVKNRE